MDCKEKVNLIFKILSTTNAEIAKVSQIDPSLISRYRTGIRHPSSESKHFINFCNGIASYAQKKGVWNKLYLICNLTEEDTPGNSILRFLLSPDYIHDQSSDCLSSISTGRTFSEKLNLLMEILELSNIKLAKALNVDTSLISRLKNGKRIPKRGNTLIESMCFYFQEKIKMKGLSTELIKWLELPDNLIDIEDERFIKYFSEWLISCNAPSNKTINNIVNEIEMPLPALCSKPTQNANRNSSFPTVNSIKGFYGDNGLQRAFIILLNELVKHPKAQTIKIYSDHNLDRITSSQIISKYLKSFGSQLYAAHIKFSIIHNIDINSDKMLSGLEKWLPIYHYGLLDKFNYISPASGRFSYTLIVVPDVAVIFSANVTGTEAEGLYIYSTAKDEISYFNKQFHALMQTSKPLFHVFTKQTRNNYYFLISKLAKSQGCIKRLIASPSCFTMPPKLLDRILERAQLNEAECQWIKDRHTDLSILFEQGLKNYQVVDYIFFPKPEDIRSGKSVIHFSDFFMNKPILYLADEYIEHIKSLISLLDYPNYHIVPLSSMPIKSARIIIKDPNDAFIKYSEGATLRFNQPSIYNAFNEYIDNITTNYKLPLYTKNEIIYYLNKYIL